MIKKIGVSSKAFDGGKWIDRAQKSKFNIIEINKKVSSFHLVPKYIDEIKSKLKNKSLSLHSGTSWVFTPNKQFTRSEIETLKAEIIICKTLQAKELVFHLKYDPLNQNETKELKKIISFAQKNKVNLTYESGAQLDPVIALDNLKKFPKLDYNLDLGHLNVGLNKSNFDLEKFLKKIKNRTTYLHVHGNNGEKDQHRSLTDSTLDWQFVLDSLNMNKIKKIIMEVYNSKDAQKTHQALKKYFKK